MTQHHAIHDPYWKQIWRQFKHRKSGYFGLIVVFLFCLAGIYAPFLASSKPFFVCYDGECYFPLFRYLFFSGFYTKRLDLFFNLLIFTFPFFISALYYLEGNRRKIALWVLSVLQAVFFIYIAFGEAKDPASDPQLTIKRLEAAKLKPLSWNEELAFMTPYAKLNMLLRAKQMNEQQLRLANYAAAYEKATGKPMPTLWQIHRDHLEMKIKSLQEMNTDESRLNLKYLQDREDWLQSQTKLLKFQINPLIRSFHWEDDAGGEQSLNQYIPWSELTRINRKDLIAALIFGVRISLVVGITAVVLAMAIGIPIGAFAGYYGGATDIIVSRLLEIWESMPVFFMLLLVVAVTQSKSIFLVIAVIGFFSWTTFSRYIRAEFFKQRNLPYVEACHAEGFNDPFIMYKQILPNAIPPLLTLLPFAVMGAITSEAGLSFLGLGEEGSCSWGVLMDEGRTAFPSESYLLWPPAILLTILLVAIALVGDALRDAFDPKLHKILL